MFIGGDFGGKGLSIDEYPCYYLAKATRPAGQVGDDLRRRAGEREPAARATCYLRTAVDESGRMIAHESRVYFHDGAYAAGPTQCGPILDGWSALDAYGVPNAGLETFVCYTNTVTGGQMRPPAPPRPHVHRGEPRRRDRAWAGHGPARVPHPERGTPRDTG